MITLDSINEDNFLYYFAGVLDSDGSLTIYKRHPKRPLPNYGCLLQLTWLDSPQSRKVMGFLVTTYGGSIFETVPHSSFGSTRPILKYLVQGNHLLPLARKLADKAIIKNRQLLNVIEALEINTKNRGRRRPPEDSARLEELHQSTVAMNKGV